MTENKLLVFFIGLFLAVAAMVGIFIVTSSSSSSEVPSSDNQNVTFYHDDLRGVGCWIWINYLFDAGGISCLPDEAYTQVGP